MAKKIRKKLQARRNAARGLASLIKTGNLPDGAATRVVIDPVTGEEKIVAIDPVTGKEIDTGPTFGDVGQEADRALLESEAARQAPQEVTAESVGNGTENKIDMTIPGTFTPEENKEVASIVEEIAADNTGAPEKDDPIVNVPVAPPRSKEPPFNNDPSPNSLKSLRRVRADLGDIEGTFRNPIVSEITQAIKSGDLELADQLVKTGRNVASLASSFRKDLSPEALLVDRLRARQQRRLGKAETNQLTATRQLEGEKRSPFDLDQDQFARGLQSTRLLGNLTDARRGRDIQTRAVKNKMESMLADLNQTAGKLRLADAQIANSRDENERKQLQNFMNRALDDAEAKEDAISKLITILINSNKSSEAQPFMKKLEEAQARTQAIRESNSDILNKKAVKSGILERLKQRGTF